MSSSAGDRPLSIGPVQCGTLLARDANAVAQAYREWLDLVVVDDAPLSPALAAAWGKPALAGAAHVANIFVCAIAAIASVLAVIRITLGA